MVPTCSGLSKQLLRKANTRRRGNAGLGLAGRRYRVAEGHRQGSRFPCWSRAAVREPGSLGRPETYLPLDLTRAAAVKTQQLEAGKESFFFCFSFKTIHDIMQTFQAG